MKLKRTRKFAYRAYLDGIRGISVILVVLFHTGVERFKNCFLGVDVFFILSGYLITSIIIAEIESTQNIDILRFCARRARRILPGASISLIIITLFDCLFIDPYTVDTHGKCLKAASAYMANQCFIMQSTDYWASEFGQSPIKHYWSLSIEEQFYLFYPIFLLVIVRLYSKFSGSNEESDKLNTSGNSKKLKITIMIGIFVLVSFSLYYALYLLFQGSLTLSHMSSFGRVYQLGSGAILGIILDLRRGKASGVYFFSKGTFRILSSVFACLMLCLMLHPIISGDSISLLPSVSGMIMTIVVICFIFCMESETLLCENDGVESNSLCRELMKFSVLIYFGKWSYSVYLWHFPLVVFGDELGYLPKNWFFRIFVIFGASTVIGIFSYYCFEKPFMRIRMDTPIRKKLLASMGLIVPITSFILISFLLGTVQLDKKMMDDSIDASDLGKILLTKQSSLSSSGLLEAKKVMLYGDSHLIQSSPMWEGIANQIGFEVMVFQGGAMPPYVFDFSKPLPWHGWAVQKTMAEDIKRFQPDLFVIYNWSIIRCKYLEWIDQFGDSKSQDHFTLSNEEHEFLYQKIYEEYKRFLNELVFPNGVTFVLHFLPEPEHIIGEKRIESPAKCSGEGCTWNYTHFYTYPAAVSALRKVEEESEGKLKLVKLDDWICPDGKCPLKYDDMFVYRDSQHVRKEYWIHRANDFVELLLKEGVSLVPLME